MTNSGAIWRSFLLFRHQSHITSSAPFIVTGFMKGDTVKLRSVRRPYSRYRYNQNTEAKESIRAQEIEVSRVRQKQLELKIAKLSNSIQLSGVGEVTGKTLLDLHSFSSHAEVLM